MTPAPVPRQPVSAATPSCAHCGLAVPASLVRESDAEQFCCNGCRQVYALVREWGFEHYYRLVDRQQATIEPARVSGRSFEDFDDERLQAEASDGMTADRRRTRLYLEGVHCAACVWLVEKLPAVLAGVDEVRLNYGSAVAEVTWRPGSTRLSSIARALDRLGYTPHVHRASRSQEARRVEDRAMLARLGVAVACAMNLMMVSGALYAGEHSGMATSFETFFRWLSLLVAIPVLSFSAQPFFQTAMAGLRAGIVHIDLPIAVAVAIAALASAWNTVTGSGPIWFDSLAMLIAALLGARQLQRSAQRLALERADSLRGVAFLEFARRLEGDDPNPPVVEVPLSALVPGDRVEVRSGELVPVDGIVLAGQSSLNNAVLTGEAAPLAVTEGDAVNAGATNLGARLIVRVQAVGTGTRVGALLALVQDAASQRPALVQTTDILARRFVHVLLVVAAVTLATGWLLSGPELALTRVVALLVVSCPCALGLAVPLAMSVALMRAARAGIFIKNPDALERLRHVDTVLLDKTGTLTEGRATVARWHGDDFVLELAQTLEAESSHGVARAFAATPRKPLHVVRSVAEVVEVAGRGIAGVLDGHKVRIGNRDFIEAGAASIDQHRLGIAESMLADGLSPVLVAVDGRVCGIAGIGDRLRRDSFATVATLRRRGLRVRILSGDHAGIVARVAEQLGLPPEDALGGLTPEAKRDIVAGLVSGAGRAGAVMMVGDGVNDAAALALADVGIAVDGGMGATIVAADIVLTREGVASLLDVLDGARRLRAVIRRNIALSLFYNAGASSMALAGIVGPLLAAVLMPVSSLTVVLSSALTRTFVIARPRPARRAPLAARAA
ncbi:MAG: heavy metal translocating P-type ATPase metal-binding domain-containing protein [Acidobacteriota bacterium]|nr:heavy metal translocating P-type ATPase metal-binding domain-containing protein [Acidobacteriota bacterium]